MNLTTKELAERWKVSASHLANLRSQKKGPPFFTTATGTPLYRLADIEAIEAMNYVPSPWLELKRALSDLELDDTLKTRIISATAKRLGHQVA